MISKVIPPGKSFAGLCQYLFQNKEKAEVILCAGVRDYDSQKMASDFATQAAQNPRLKSPVLHIIISWPPDENIAADLMKTIVKEYLESLHLSDTQFAVVKHNDRKHQHVHLVVNRVSNNGKTIRDNYIGLRGKKIAQQLTQKYGLKIANDKHLGQTDLTRLHGKDAARYEIFAAIHDLLPECKNLEDLKQRLAHRQISILYKYKGQSNEVQGISFCKGELKFKGSEIDRSFSYNNLQKMFARKQQRLLHKTRQHKLGISQPDHDKQLSQATKLLYELMKPEFTQDFVPNELIKKKRRKSLGL